MKSIFNRSSKGFTLIELLVVIAIIAILATIILASLGTARQRARNTRVMSELSQMRAQAELYAGGQTPIPTYDGVCDAGKSDDGLKDLVISAKRVAGDTSGGMESAAGNCFEDGNSWVAAVTIANTTPELVYCADSTGFAGPGSKASNQFYCDPAE